MILFVRKPEFTQERNEWQDVKCCKVVKELPGSMQLLRQTVLETVYLLFKLFKLNFCVVVVTYSILVYVYAKIEYVSVRTYHSKNGIRTNGTIRILFSSFGS